ncbi:MAG: diphosphate--fructose-6-phosphate 1-phosphotransferase [Spirochaetes bacterium]|jgi:pyrophosphate--fructose-6-phosphate 1-phosphotransferase|nr:diphosphate--fructose-6-phosphate 1-phosphotransferase [Spirochaetota bacterium]
MERSVLQEARYEYEPRLPSALTKPVASISASLGEATESLADHAELKKIFEHSYGAPIAEITEGDNPDATQKLTVGVVLSGGQAAGGHNVILGLLEGLKAGNAESKLLGFLNGPAGILEDDCIELTPKFVSEFRNTGGFDMIGSGRTKIESEEQFTTALHVCENRGVNALVIIGGDDSNTNAALLAEYFQAKGSDVRVIGVPKTIDGDLKSTYIEVSFGFDTAAKTYSELIGNIARDASSARKYWHFIKLMGRSASHIALECALQTHPNVCIISEEVAAKSQTLDQIVDTIVQTVITRCDNGYNYGIALVPEGLIEAVPEMKSMIGEMNDILANEEHYFETLHTFEEQTSWINKKLSRDSSYVFSSLPDEIQRQLLMDRDPHGNVQVSRIETEKLLIEMVDTRLGEMRSAGKFTGKFSALQHFFGYEGRSGFPSNFDSDYCYSLGYTAFALIANKLTGYMAAVRNLAEPHAKWEAAGIPLTMMMNLEQRKGKKKPVIKKALVDLNDKPFREFASNRDAWAVKNDYCYPGSIQYFGPAEVADQPTITLRLENE